MHNVELIFKVYTCKFIVVENDYTGPNPQVKIACHHKAKLL